jgi:GGDEF domain-containing protein
MQPSPPRRRPARPVCDAAVEALLRGGEDLAKGWLIALVEQVPLEQAHEILSGGGDFAREAPWLCEALVRALVDDADLRRIGPGGELEHLASRAGELAGARGAEAAARSVDTLLAVIWSALRAELGSADADMICAVAERLALVGELVRGAVLRALVDGARSVAGESAGHARWSGALADEIARCERTGAPLSLLLVELDDADRVVAAESSGEASAMFGRFGRAVREVMRRHDTLARETDARAWVIARDTGRAGAVALGSRIDAAVRAAPAWRGAPLTVDIGIAVLGENGHDPAALIEAAEVAKFAAQASGIEIARALQGDQTPPGAGPERVS